MIYKGKPIERQQLVFVVIVLTVILFVLLAVVIVMEIRNSNTEVDQTINASDINQSNINSTINNAESGMTIYPWEQPYSKDPEEYTWNEFLNLPADLQIAFQNAFESSDAFEEWMNSAQSTEDSKYPWEQPGAKSVEEYTWNEFLNLPADLQIAFQNAFEAAESFETWLNREMPQS